MTASLVLAFAAVWSFAAAPTVPPANKNLQAQLATFNTQLDSLKADNQRLAAAESARQQAEQRAAALAADAAQLATTQQQLAALRADNARLADQTQALDRDRATRLSQAQAENAALAARLRQAQDALDQIASATRLITGTPSVESAPRPPVSTSVPPSVSTAAARYHLVAEGESLSLISLHYFGTANRWQEIYDANRELLKGENSLRPGQRLRIP